jgi:hypothetical protein
MRLRMTPVWLAFALVGGSLGAAEAPRSPAPGTTTKAPIVCTTDYKPVCGHDKDGKQRTFSNECLAKAAGVTGIYPGPCVADITNQ